MTTQKEGGRFFQGLFIGLGIVAATYILVDGLKGVIPSNQIVKVRGFAEKEFTSDLARWTINVKATRTTLAEASSALQADTEKVVGYLSDNGIGLQHISLKPSYASPINKLNDKGYTTNTIIAYAVDRTVEVESDDVKRIEALSSDITSLMSEGLNLSSHAPEYYYSKIAEMKMELLAAATKDAFDRATILAESSGSKLGSLRAARQGKFQITSAHETEDSGGYYDTSAIEKKMTAGITVDYSID